MSDLKPCPFCGGEAEIERYTIKPYVACMKCGCSMPDRHQTAEQAIAAWNSRADYHGYEQAAIEAWEIIKAWNSRAERPCSMTRADRLLEELNNDRRINKQLKMANALLRKSEAAKIERIEELEELARDLHADLMEYGCTPNAHRANYKPRFEALGIEVGDDV